MHLHSIDMVPVLIISNAGIDSSIIADPAHRGTLSTPELELIHQSASYKQAMHLEKEDKLELTAKNQQIHRVQEYEKLEK